MLEATFEDIHIDAGFAPEHDHYEAVDLRGVEHTSQGAKWLLFLLGLTPSRVSPMGFDGLGQL